jgi:hypothetical protein
MNKNIILGLSAFEESEIGLRMLRAVYCPRK